jgi:D-3-phosphoglycerate dehydrogenase / 2-oxoglutarate reductase
MAFFRYDDRPGVIGTIGTGSARPASTSPRPGRPQVAGNEAIMALSLDEAVPREVLQRITEAIGAHEGRSITLG